MIFIEHLPKFSRKLSTLFILVTPRQIYSSQPETSQNSTKETIHENGTNVSKNGQSDHKSDTMATIYAGIVIGIIVLIVVALMTYLSRKKVCLIII